jgi:SSS family solute:Na+ symporter
MERRIMKPIVVILAMVGWTAVTIAIAAAAKRGMGQGASEFFIGGRRIKGFLSGMTYAATTYSAFMLVGLVGLTYRLGVGALGFEMTYLGFTLLFLLVFGPRFWLVGKKHNLITPPELLAHRYENKWVALVAAVISFVMLIPYSSVQMIGAGLLVEGLTGGSVPFIVGVVVMALLSGVTAIWAGMRSVSWTDAFQAIAMILTSVIALLFVFFRFFDAPEGFFGQIQVAHPDLLEFTWSPSLFVGLALPWAFFALTNPQVSQRLFVPDRLSSMRRMVIYFAVFGFLYTIISTLIMAPDGDLLRRVRLPLHHNQHAVRVCRHRGCAGTRELRPRDAHTSFENTRSARDHTVHRYLCRRLQHARVDRSHAEFAVHT